MSGIKLTREAKRSIAIIYKEYNNRRYSGQSKAQAVKFKDADASKIEGLAFAQNNLDELKRAGLVKTFIYGDFDLTDAGIIYMEEKPIDTIKEWLSLVTSFIP